MSGVAGAVEVNFDGLVGPTHNYGGLAHGNLAAAANEGKVSNPREAALQGLTKMRWMLRQGLVQGCLPPQERPHVAKLSRCTPSPSTEAPARCRAPK